MQSPSVKAFQWAFAKFVEGVVPDQLEFWPTTNCARCGRPLTVPTSVHNGFGPDCITKVGIGMDNQPLNKQAASAQMPLSAGILNLFVGYFVGHVQSSRMDSFVVRPSVVSVPSDVDVFRMVDALR